MIPRNKHDGSASNSPWLILYLWLPDIAQSNRLFNSTNSHKVPLGSMNFSRHSTAGEQGNVAGDPREVPVQQDVPSPNRLTRSRQATREYQIKGSSPFHPHHVSVFQKHLPKRANATPPYHIISSVLLLLIRNMVLNRLFYFNDPSTEPNQPYQVPCKLQWSLKDQIGHHHRNPSSC